MSEHNNNSPLSRRSLLKVAGLGAIATSVYSYFRGIRFPVLSWEPAALESNATFDGIDFIFNDLIHTSHTDDIASFRAFAPEPVLQVSSPQDKSLRILVNNIATDAVLSINDSTQLQFSEEIQGITRKIDISFNSAQTVSLKWRLPDDLSTYTFAAIGDTGGDKELGWCIDRAHALGARFLLHLGDFNYQQGDYDNAIEQFNQAPLPCYITIGNHDFNESGLVYQQFLNEIGPLNNSFSIGETRFINIDTAASVVPYSGGNRGKLMQQLVADTTEYSDNVVFTHMPLHDPQPIQVREENGDHDIGSEGETDWLIESLNKIKAKTLLSGHIHIFDRSTYRGIDNIIVGQGLGHQDLLVNHNDISKIAIGQVSENGTVNYEFASLKMPMELHCNSRIQVVKDSLIDSPHAENIKQIDIACNEES